MKAKPLKNWNKRMRNHPLIVAASHSSAFQMQANNWYGETNVEIRGAVADLGADPESFEIAAVGPSDDSTDIRNCFLQIIREKIKNDLHSFNILAKSKDTAWTDITIKEIESYLEKEGDE